MMRLAQGSLLAAALILAGCSGGRDSNGDVDLSLTAGQAILDAIRTRGAGEASGIAILPTRADLDATPGQILQVTPEGGVGPDFLQRIETRADDFGREVEVWQSSDKAYLILRGGVLVGTKGLGGDIRSAEAGAATSGFDGNGGGGERLVVIDRGDGKAQTVAFSCDMTQLGTEVIQIVDQRVTTRRMREDCTFGNAKFSNEYWVEPGRERVRKSRQWAGPTLGYFDMVLLKN
jgi:hypothetical protein